MDAHRREVFSALYRVADGACVSRGLASSKSIAAASAIRHATLERWSARAVPIDLFIGDGRSCSTRIDRSAADASSRRAACWRARSGSMAVDRARRGETRRSGGRVQPLYVRRPDVEIERETRRLSWIVEPLTSPAEIDDVLAVEDASFTNPWTREMYLAELENPGVVVLLSSPETPSGRVVGFCSFWRVLDELHINNLAVLPGVPPPGRGVGAAGARARRGARGWAPARHAGGPALERCGAAALRALRVRRSPASAAATTRNPVEDALVLWREEPDAQPALRPCRELETSGSLCYVRRLHSGSCSRAPTDPSSGPHSKEAEHE